MEHCLDTLQVPFDSILHGEKSCESADHIFELENYYSEIIKAIESADSTLPCRRHGISKSFWSPELYYLKQRSIDSCELWKSAGKPQSGANNREKCTAHYKYKRALKKAKLDDSREVSDELYHNVISKDNDKFWKKWNTINGRDGSNVTRISGHVDNKLIAGAFRGTFNAVYCDADNAANDHLKQRFKAVYDMYFKSHCNDCISPFLISWSELLSVLENVKSGKATGSFIKA
jgi:hypothetical protein